MILPALSQGIADVHRARGGDRQGWDIGGGERDSRRRRQPDEPDIGWIGPALNHENQPDTFTVDVTGPTAGISGSGSGNNAHGQEGTITFSVDVPVMEEEAFNGTGDWVITINVEAGNHDPNTGIGVAFTDSGNDFTLEMTYEHYVKPEKWSGFERLAGQVARRTGQ